MFRILEIVGLLAPVVGSVLIVRYRRRSRIAFAWAAIACAAALAASAIGVFSGRVSVAAAIVADEGIGGVLERMDGWALARFVLLLVAGGLLVVAALADRRERRPSGWIAAGILALLAGIALHLVVLDAGADRPRLTAILGVLLEIAQTGLLGVGFLLLCVAAIAHRPSDDGRAEPAEVATRLGAAVLRRATAARGTDR